LTPREVCCLQARASSVGGKRGCSGSERALASKGIGLKQRYRGGWSLVICLFLFGTNFEFFCER